MCRYNLNIIHNYFNIFFSLKKAPLSGRGKWIVIFAAAAWQVLRLGRLRFLPRQRRRVKRITVEFYAKIGQLCRQ